MAKALFLGLSAAFFIAYALVANALLIPDQKTITFGSNELGCITQGEGADEECISDDPAVRIPILGPIIETVANVISVGVQLFSPFFQLLTFQAEGLGAASFLTLLIFTPLLVINSFIIFSTIRGS